MNRPSGQFPAMHRRLTGGVLLLLGIAAAVLGLLVAGVEFYHSVESRHPVIWQNLAGALGLIAGGAGLIQTGSVRETLGIVRAAIPLFQSQRLDGERSTDPQTIEHPTKDDAA